MRKNKLDTTFCFQINLIHINSTLLSDFILRCPTFSNGLKLFIKKNLQSDSIAIINAIYYGCENIVCGLVILVIKAKLNIQSFKNSYNSFNNMTS